MDFKNIVKKQTAIIGVSVIGLSLILIGTSYALFFKVDKSTETQVVKTGNLTFTSSVGTRLTADLSPVDDTTGQGSTGYTFTVTNNGTLPASYDLVVYNDPEVYTTDALKATSVPFANIKVSVDGGAPMVINTLPLDSASQSISNSAPYYEHQIKYIIASGLTLVGKTNNSTDARTHTVRVWIKEDAEEEGTSGGRVALKVDAAGKVLEGNTYTVTFNTNGGNNLPASYATKLVGNGGTYGFLPTPTYDGHTFAGWFTDASAGTQVTNSTIVSLSATQTLYAHWN